MPEIILVRHPDIHVTDHDKEAARRVLFAHIDGLGDKGKKQWRRLISNMFRLEEGEAIEITTHQNRLSWYHKKHMKLEQTLFESQEQWENFDQFRDWLKIGAGFVDWFPGPVSGIVPVAKSISYAQLEQGAMEKVHADMVQFLRTERAINALWPHLPAASGSEMMEIILGGFGE